MTKIVIRKGLDKEKLSALKLILDSWNVEAEFDEELQISNENSKFRGSLKMTEEQKDFEVYLNQTRSEWQRNFDRHKCFDKIFKWFTGSKSCFFN